MAFIDWKDNYSVGINIIDAQHIHLVKIRNELHDALQESQNKEIINQILQNLVDFVHFHFKTEEELMVKYDFKEYTIHRYEHEKLTDEMKRVHNDYIDGNIRISPQLTSFFKDWLMDHIVAKDKKLAGFLTKKGIK